MENLFTEEDLVQITEQGLSEEAVQRQIEAYRAGFPHTTLAEAATVENGGIIKLSDEAVNHYCTAYSKLSKGKKIQKFIPASGAASRMFKDLYSFSSTYFGVSNNFEKEFPEVKRFLEHIHQFAFFPDLRHCMKAHQLDIGEYISRGDYSTIINFLLQKQYLGYGHLPKALLKFHNYGNIQRTPIEEHIVEGAEYAQMSDGTVALHFTVSPEHRQLFRKKINAIKSYYEESLDIKLQIKLSEQKHYTDIIAVDEYNTPIRDENNRLVFRPGGHGALIENLNEMRSDIIFVKNIDNVVPDWMKHSTVVYKKALAGMLLELQEEVFRFLTILSSDQTEVPTADIARFATERLQIILPDGFAEKGCKEQRDILFTKLNRPMRICGMVRNQGEPGGGPFYTINTHGNKSLQIVESAQVNHKDPEQESIFTNSTHFNPVDLICSTKTYRNRYFKLGNYVDADTGFIAKKSKGAQIVKSQELPGLWNGAMADWITLFVEVPLATFNPVKIVTDLLRKEHREG